MEAVVPPQCAFNRDAVALLLDHGWGGHQGCLVAVEILDKGFDAALVAHFLALLDRMPHVGKDDCDAGVEESKFAQAMLQRREIELRHRERLLRRKERHLRAALAWRRPHDLEGGLRISVAKFDVMFLAVTPDREPEPG